MPQDSDVNDPFLSHAKGNKSLGASGWGRGRQQKQVVNAAANPKAYKKEKKSGSSINPGHMMALASGYFLISSTSMMVFWELYKPLPIFLAFLQLAAALNYKPEMIAHAKAAAAGKLDVNKISFPGQDDGTLLPALSGPNAAAAMQVWLRVVCAWLAVLLGAVCGMNAEEKYMSHFYALSFGREYDNVLASSHGAAYSDAGLINFAASSTVDPARSVGFKEGYDYCAAPVIDTDQGRKSVAFWAIGYDCCDKRGNFECGDMAATTHKGTRAPPDGVFHKDTGMFMKAVEQAAAVHDLDIDEDVVLLHWVKDPQGHRFKMFFAALGGVLLGNAIFALLAFVVIGIGVMLENQYLENEAAQSQGEKPTLP